MNTGQGKILSIIVPTYNMEELLPRCLDSLLATGGSDGIEAIVVNDGSKDNSFEVAKRYEAKYPDCVVVIDKPNGNYGSTINAALPVAKGKYVKILDSDDWFDSKSLSSFIEELEQLDVDMVVTHFNIIHDDGTTELSKYNVYGREPYDYGKVYDLDYVLSGGYIRFFLMHGLAYRTELLRSSGYRQTEGISYTDTEWCIYPLFYAKDIVFFDIVLYQYNLAREGQTMDPKVLLRSLDQMCRMTFNMFDFYDKFDKGKLSDIRLSFLKQYFRNRIRILSKCYLYDIPRNEFNADVFAKVDEELQAFRERNGIEQIKLIPENKLLRIDFYKYWCKHHKRLPLIVERINHMIDIVVKGVYMKIFR